MVRRVIFLLLACQPLFSQGVESVVALMRGGLIRYGTDETEQGVLHIIEVIRVVVAAYFDGGWQAGVVIFAMGAIPRLKEPQRALL